MNVFKSMIQIQTWIGTIPWKKSSTSFEEKMKKIHKKSFPTKNKQKWLMLLWKEHSKRILSNHQKNNSSIDIATT